MSLVDLGKRLLESAKLGETDEVRILMTNGAPFTTDWLGISALHLASQYGHVETAEVLLRGGISRDARTKVDRTPLHIAAQEGHADIVELLITQGAEIDARDMLRMTPLHWSVQRGHLNVTKLLLLYYADVHAVSKFEKTPLDIAEDNQDKAAIQLLAKHISDPNPAPVKKNNSKRPVNLNLTHLIPAGQNVKVNLPIPVRSGALSPITVDIKPVINSVFVAPPLRTVSSPVYTKSATTAKSQSTSKPTVLHANLATLQKAAAGGFAAKKVFLNSSEDSESNETTSTSVLATLAALAEATAPNSNISTSEALQWLEMNGITMLPTDNSTIVASAVEGGQTVSLTEAGKLALTWVKEHQNINNNTMDVSSSVSDTSEAVVSSRTSGVSQKVITIVADQARIPSIISSPQTPIVVLSSQTSIPADDSEPVAKKVKANSSVMENVTVVTNGNSAISSEEDERLKLKRELEQTKKEAELYKAQFLAKQFEAQNYKKQLEEMRTRPKNLD